MRRSAFVAGTAGALVAGPRAARGAPAGAPFDGRTRIPVVRARAAGRDLLFAFDTGSSQSALSQQTAGALGFAGTLAGITVAERQLHAHPAVAGDLGKWNAQVGFALDGVLGYEAFRDSVVTLDYRSGRLTFPDTLPDGETTTITWLRYDDGSPPLVTFADVTVDGFPAVAQLDTMMSKIAVIFETKFPDLAIDNDPRAPAYEYAGEQLRPGRIGSVRLGTTTLAASAHVYSADARAHVPATEISLVAGDALFARRALTLDFPGSRLIVT
jgi:hypothetical protein